MKRYIKLLSVAAIAALTLMGTGCKKILEEHPQASIVPSFFNSQAGVLGGIAGVYNDIRNLWGTEGFYITTHAGTDEVREGELAQGELTYYTYNGMNSLSGNVGALWNQAYPDINTLNGVIQFGASLTGLDDVTKKSYLAQAYFLRAFYYYYLVITYGSCPLHTTFISTPSKADSKASVADIYTQIIADLNYAVTNLQVSSPAASDATHPFGGKAASQATAQFLLGKVYLTRGYSSVGSPADFTQAATILSTLITNKGTYGADLWPDFAQAFYKANDYGKEVLFNSDHSSDIKYGEYISQSSGNNGNNLLPWFNRANYSGDFKEEPGTTGGLFSTSGNVAMTRDVNNGRPFGRYRPNLPYVLTQSFFNATLDPAQNDTRYNKTFQTVWIANTAVVTSRGTFIPGVDTAFWIPPYEVAGAPTQRNGTNFKGIIVPPSLQPGANNTYFPTVKKFDDSSRTIPNDPSTRPVCIMRFAEAYLLCAEAYFKAGDLTNAAKYINYIRERAAYRATNTGPQNAAAALAMDITPGQVTIDFILDERTRELYAEGTRWWDLVRTGQLLNRVHTWNPVEAGAHIDAHNVLRPIPQTQIDRVVDGANIGSAYWQNPGY